ncbi:tripartite motif-containing protein 16-like [Polypterus senegalus]|uniref:tripartite motif-containing protein 16-like n=1 Tax=Polypterus senegalus TaxID=55291 RepID=UPI001965BE30|nr:tripartite motif-containing protein 16-like [Polypterus senegalus]
MEESNIAPSKDQFSCLVCLEILNNPVTIPCGHNYCKKCIEACWDHTGEWSCPYCRETFGSRPLLRRNTLLVEIVEMFKTESRSSSPGKAFPEPVDVYCDVCPGRMERAVQTCLTCLASYCQTHLQPHMESEALKKHKLELATGNLQQKLCKEHQTPVQVYCRTDQTCVCLLCAAVKHKDHEVVEPEAERADKQIHVLMTLKEIKKRNQEREDEVAKAKQLAKELKCVAETNVQEQEGVFSLLVQSIDRLKSEVTTLIREHERKEVRRTEEHIERMEKEIEELTRKDAELTKLLQTDDHIHFLQKFSSLTWPPGDGAPPHITVNKELLPESLRKDLTDLKKSLQEISSRQLVKVNGTEDPVYVLQELITRSSLLKNSCRLTLDPNTVHTNLHLSEENRKVTYSKTESPYPNHADRFDWWLQVLCTEGLIGSRCYWEVEWSGRRAEIGIAYKGLCRKGYGDVCCLGRNDKSWCLCCLDSRYSMWHNNKETIIMAPCCSKIGVHLNCPTGVLSFYNVSDNMTLLYRFKASFSEPLYPGFRIGIDSSIRICQLDFSD